MFAHSAHIWRLSLILSLHIVFSEANNLPVCIIGAGPSGLSAARALDALGRTTVIFEQQESVGGRAQNYYEDGLAFHLGPLIGPNASYTETLKIIKEVNVPIAPYGSGDVWLFNWTTGETWAGESQMQPSPKLLDEVARFTLQWQTEYRPFASTLYKTGVPSHLTISTTEWFSRGNYPTLQSYITRLLADWGNGNADDIPILYTLGIFSPLSLVGTPFQVDYHEVFERYSQTITRGTIHLRSRIQNIDRSGDTVNIHYSFDQQADESQGGLSQQSCSDIILAFPPTIQSLQDAGLELSSAESTVFSAVETINYFSAAIRLDIPHLTTFMAATSSPTIAPEGAGQPIFIQNMYDQSDIAYVYAWTESGQTVAQVETVMLETLSRINKNPQDATGQTTPVELSDIRALRHHPENFPHFNSTCLEQGWYKKYSALQGVNRTYYTSGLNMVEDVEFAIRAARDLVHAHFIP